MLRTLRPALLLATATVTAGVLAVPGAAFAADTTTQLTAAQMAAALKTVAGTTGASAAKGWAGGFTLTGKGGSGTATFVTDPVGGRAYTRVDVPYQHETTYAVAKSGVYESLSTAKEKAAVTMMRKTSVKFVFTAKPTLNLTSWTRDNSADPSTVLTGDTEYAGTKVEHADNSATYKYDDGEEGSYSFEVSATGELTSAKISLAGYLDATYTWRYGAQSITLPTAAQTVGSATMTKALAYVNLRTDVQKLAKKSAADVRTAANKHTVRVSVLRKVVKRDVAKFNKAAKVTVVKVTAVTGGVRISARNPWTGVKVTYTIKASGKKVLVTKK
ncbi:hypothetical protein GCM10010168_13530 [Actinoplanes ianthinogenes]|uniref:Lipoprotein n=1 Tax=Actinoplanes ianthinogenes TaxID=122358 RepID=A0ABM7LYY3_9ACTN|nr:hypothetical protein [Actinoplanes ianthinogenes]BCJ44540.1 hypothetical protein Aiant_51970 [Actinoplanes ianthinogenes]GGQ98628.1 hypothetical protein GCM10010168_13530 [Actinoplanes ianthinogenes]